MLILLTSHHWILLWGTHIGHCVPGCATTKNMGQHIIDRCAATSLQVIEQSRQLCINFNSQHNGHHLQILLLAQNAKLFIQIDISDILLLLHIIAFIITRMVLCDHSSECQKNIDCHLKTC
jgi:hypothetical protein